MYLIKKKHITGPSGCGLGHSVLAAWLLELWVRIPLKVRMFVFVFLCCPVYVEAIQCADHSS
jgi:hypothetical protein